MEAKMKFVKLGEWFVNLDRLSAVKEKRDSFIVGFLDHNNQPLAVQVKKETTEGTALLLAIQSSM